MSFKRNVKLEWPALPSLMFILMFSIPSICFGEDALKVEISTIVSGDADWDWTQARTAYLLSETPYSLTTMSQTAKKGAHGYHDVSISFSRNHGGTWSKPEIVPTLRRMKQPDGYDIVAGDFYPMWHQASQKVLITGKTFNFRDGKKENILLEKVSYTVFDPDHGQCGPMLIMEMPELDHSGKTIIAPNAGCHQRVDLPNGDVLLPVRYQTSNKKRIYRTVVARCKFDGKKLSCIEHGTEHSISTGRGLYEPSIASFNGSFFLTMRANDGAFVSKSKDGINYSKHKPWIFDDGQLLGSENTQQHWATIGKKLFLIYTRHGADNDHIMRHRAPLFIAEVDPDRLHVIRSTEQILVPENDATLGNSGVCYINENESWVTVAEGRLSYGSRKEENNKVILVKISVP